MLQLIDTHCHLDNARFDADRGAQYEAALASGVQEIWLPAVSVANFAAVKSCCASYTACRAAYGIHPFASGLAGEADLRQLRQWLTRERPFALGEIGLDGYIADLDWQKQMKWFRDQLYLAREFDLPVLLHLRRAVEPVLQCLRAVFGKTGGAGGVAHAYNGSLQQAQALFDMGFKLGFGGAATFPGSKRIRQVLKELPLTAIVLETDAPDIPPAWLDGGRNSPAQLARIAGELAEARGSEVAELAAQTTKNAASMVTTISNPAKL